MGDFSFLIPLIKVYGYWVVAIGIFLESMGVPFPGETVLILGGVAASLGQLNLGLVIFIASCAAIIGDNMGYFIGKKFGKKLLKKLERFWIFHPMHIEKAEKFFKDHGNKTVFIGRFTAILRTYAAVLAGVFEMPYTTFFFYNFTGGVTWAVLMGYVGYLIGNNLHLLGKIIKDMNIFVFGLLGILVVVLLIRHYYYANKKAKCSTEPLENKKEKTKTHKTAAPLMDVSKGNHTTNHTQAKPDQDSK